ncbi:hypothetical protein M0765_026445 [Variovorax sp. S2]|uniref:hypothetical protein n=1 Tax=Variovorax sp. S12S4 TaxID=3029170 RepID=UPI00215D4B33|nr:hypothetical protein [Variovorax sp. S12S4]MCR8961139.1 hypothetical protein [Variovorax sp. S12S4]
MSLISLPFGFCPSAFTLRMQTNQRAFGSPFGGSEQVIDLLNDRWLISLTLPNRLHADAARVEAFIASLRGMTNTVNLYHWVRKIPRGTLRGTPTVIATTPAGNPFLHVQAVAGQTVLAGDMLGVGGLLLQVKDDATADGSGFLVVNIANRLRRQIAAGTAVIWDRPTAPFRLSSPSAVQYIPGYAPEVSMDFVEDIG